MSFATPLMLLGLLAIAIPVWLHFKRRRGAAILFPAAGLLVRVAKQQKRRIQVRHFILLMARIVIMILVVMALARPSVLVHRLGGIRTGAELGIVIVLDNSMSMRLLGPDDQMIFHAAKEQALAELDRLRPGDAAAVVFSGRPVEVAISEPKFDLSLVRREIETANPSYKRGDMDGALRAALNILQDSPLSQREVIVFTDLTESGPNKRITIPNGINVRVLDAGPKAIRKNVAVGKVSVSPSSDGVEREVFVEGNLVNWSDEKVKGLDVILEVDGAEVARGEVDIEPNGQSTKRFSHRFSTDGAHPGVIKITNDNLSADDVRHFTAMVSRSISALVIDGEYHPGSYRDEAFYLHRALETHAPGEVPIESVVVEVDAAIAAPLSGSDVIFLAGLGNIPSVLAERLVQYVKQGGGIFISAARNGDDLKILEKLVPGKIRSIQEAPKDRAFKIASVQHDHPIFSTFKGNPTGLEQTQIRAHLLVEPAASSSRQVLVEMVSGTPLMLERRVGKGKVILLTTTIDRDWTDLPIRPGYLPLVQRSARYLANRLDDRPPRQVEVGKAIDIDVSEGMQRLVVRGPGDKDTVYSAKELAGRIDIKFGATDTPGHYKVWAEVPGFGGMKEIESLGFVVQSSPLESNLERSMKARADDEPTRFATVKGNLPIWPHLLVALIMCLFFETWLGGHGMRNSHKGRLGSSSKKRQQQ